jgi:hypothetical protein
MPTTFRDRELAFEAKFAHDEAFRFLAIARGDRLFAGWAAERLRLNHEPAEALVRQVLAIRNGPDHDQAVLRDVADYLFVRGDLASDVELSAALNACRLAAIRQLTETPPDLG